MKGVLSLRRLVRSAVFLSHRAELTSKTQTFAPNEYLVNTAITVSLPTDLGKLTKLLIAESIFHQPGRFLIINKPYGLSCVGHKVRSGGIFRDSRYDRQVPEEDDDEEPSQAPSTSLTLQDALPFLAEYFREPNLSFCCGMKRYVSGPVVLPASKADVQNIINCLKRISVTSPLFGFHHKALALCVGRPASSSGILAGYATFEEVSGRKEYVFVLDGKAKRRARTGKFAVPGCMQYRVIASNYGCSLIDLSFPKFARHLPRLMLTEILCPVLGDQLYMPRVASVDGRPVLIRPRQLHRITKHQMRNMAPLLNRLGLSEEVVTQLPMYFHVYQTLYSQYGAVDSQGGRTDLHASAPLPEHMMAMLKCLELSDAAAEHLRTCEADEGGRLSGESKF